MTNEKRAVETQKVFFAPLRAGLTMGSIFTLVCIWYKTRKYLAILKIFKVTLGNIKNKTEKALYKVLKPSIYSHSKPHTRSCMRRLKCFVLEHSVFKTKHLRLVQDLIQGFKWLEILDLKKTEACTWPCRWLISRADHLSADT